MSRRIEINADWRGREGKGVASLLLKHILEVAKERGYIRLSLETGSMTFFDPARRLYEKFGFLRCDPFGDYHADPNSVFMSRSLVEPTSPYV